MSDYHGKDESHGDGDSDKDLAVIGVEPRNFVRRLGLLINEVCCLELLSLRGWILVVTHQPCVTDFTLFSLPALYKVSGPQDDKNGVECIDWRIEAIRPLSFRFFLLSHFFLVICENSNHLVCEDYNAHDRGQKQHSCVVDKPREVEAKLSTIVFLDEIEWLHILFIGSGQEPSREPGSILLPRDVDLISFFLARVHREVVQDNFRFHQVASVEVHIEGVLDNRLCLSIVKLLEQIRCEAFEVH